MILQLFYQKIIEGEEIALSDEKAAKTTEVSINLVNEIKSLIDGNDLKGAKKLLKKNEDAVDYKACKKLIKKAGK